MNVHYFETVTLQCTYLGAVSTPWRQRCVNTRSSRNAALTDSLANKPKNLSKIGHSMTSYECNLHSSFEYIATY